MPTTPPRSKSCFYRATLTIFLVFSIGLPPQPSAQAQLTGEYMVPPSSWSNLPKPNALWIDWNSTIHLNRQLAQYDRDRNECSVSTMPRSTSHTKDEKVSFLLPQIREPAAAAPVTRRPCAWTRASSKAPSPPGTSSAPCLPSSRPPTNTKNPPGCKAAWAWEQVNTVDPRDVPCQGSEEDLWLGVKRKAESHGLQLN